MCGESRDRRPALRWRWQKSPCREAAYLNSAIFRNYHVNIFATGLVIDAVGMIVWRDVGYGPKVKIELKAALDRLNPIYWLLKPRRSMLLAGIRKPFLGGFFILTSGSVGVAAMGRTPVFLSIN